MNYHEIGECKDNLDSIRGENNKIYFLVGTPHHTNIGDRAIAMAEINFLKKNGFEPIVEVPYGYKELEQVIKSEDVVVLHGGGNFGDIWLNEEEYRRYVIDLFPNNQTILMPQTIYFDDPRQLNTSIKAYAEVKNLTLLAREKESEKIMSDNFKNTVEITPDIVMSLATSDVISRFSAIASRRKYALVLVRNDKEKTASPEVVERAIQALKQEKNINNFLWSDMHTQGDHKKMSHTEITKRKMREFRKAKIVITDRLHGMIFALLTGTPCIVFGSKTYKTSGVFEWIKSVPEYNFIRFCDNESYIEFIVNELDLSTKYSYNPNVYNKYWQKIKESLK